MGGFTSFKMATLEQLPEATMVVGPFPTVRLAGDVLVRGRQRAQQQLHGHSVREGNPIWRQAHPAHRRRPAHRLARSSSGHVARR